MRTVGPNVADTSTLTRYLRLNPFDGLARANQALQKKNPSCPRSHRPIPSRARRQIVPPPHTIGLMR